MSEEDIAANDLESNIEDARQRNDKLKRGTELEVTSIREKFNEVKNSYEKFEAKWKTEMEKYVAAHAKLQRK